MAPSIQFKPTVGGSSTSRFSNEMFVCLAIATGCGAVGAIGWLINFFSPGTTHLTGLLVVAAFYLVLAAVQGLKGKQPVTPGSLRFSIPMPNAAPDNSTCRRAG